MKKKFYRSTCLALVLGAGLSAPAYAETAGALAPPAADAEGAPPSGEIIVTARKREENVQDVPVSITAFSGETLERAGVKNFDGLATSNPNVKIQTVAGTGLAKSVAIRGNIQSSSTLAVDPSVGVYLDGQLIAHTLGSAGLTVDIANVQTLKGPQGTLFGRNTTGGAMLISTVDPRLNETSGYVSAEAGEIDTYRFGGAINIPLGSVAALRLVYQNNSQGDFQTLGNGKSFGRNKQEVLRAKLLLQPTDSLTLILSAEKNNESLNSTLDIPTHPNTPRYNSVPVTTYAGVDPRAPGQSPIDPRAKDELSTVNSEFYGLRATQDVGDGNVKLIVSHRSYSATSGLTLPPSLGFTFQDKPGNDDTAAELQYNGKLMNGLVDLSTGLFYFKEDVHERQNTFLFRGTQRTSRQLDATTESKSAYLQATVHATDALNLTGGIRYTDDKKTGILYSATLGSDANGTAATAATLRPATATLTQNRFNYLITADYSPVTGVMVYASHSTGYRSGGTGVDRLVDSPASPSYTAIGTFQPESVSNYEVGFKTEFLDRKLTLNGAAFLQNYKNYQYTAINPVTISRQTLNADATIKGFELDAKLRLPTGTTLSGNVGLVDAKVENGPSAGSSLSYIPKWTYSLSLGQNFQVGGGDLDLVANWTWRGNFWSNLNDPNAAGNEEATSNIDARGILNMSATFQTGSYTLGVYVDNATNKGYFNYITNAGGGAINFGSIGSRRVIGGRLKYAF